MTDADHVRNHVLKYLHILNSLEIEKDEDKSGQKNKELYVIEPPLQNICLAELIVPKKEYYNESRYQGQSQSYQRKYDQVSLFHTILLSLALEEGIIATNKQARVKFNIRCKEHPPIEREKYIEELVRSNEKLQVLPVKVLFVMLYKSQRCHVHKIKYHYYIANEVTNKR